jgi:hypothetical protein
VTYSLNHGEMQKNRAAQTLCSDPVLSLSEHVVPGGEAGLDFRLTLAFVVNVETIVVILP